MSRFNRRLTQCVALSLMMLAMLSSPVLAHARLTASSPASRSTVTDSLREVRLVFSEPVEVSMSRIILLSGSVRVPLKLRHDPHNANVILADLDALTAGSYQLKWNVLSADGHALSGIIPFSVVAPTSSSGSLSPATPHENVIEGNDPESSNLPGIAMFLRGLGATALLAFAGLLFFAAMAGPVLTNRFSRLASILGAAAVLALVFHFFAWISFSTAQFPGEGSAVRAFQTNAGVREVVRLLLAIFGLCAWIFTRKTRIAAFAALAAVAAGAFIGHAAVISPAASISFKAVHLAAGAVWLGGLAWLLNLSSDEDAGFATEARKVSRAAGLCALLVLVSGVIQAGIVLSWNLEALTSSYGLVAGLKLVGVGVLLLLGAYNRFKLVPHLGTAAVANALQKTVGREIVIMSLVAMLGGVLAYLSPPEVR